MKFLPATAAVLANIIWGSTFVVTKTTLKYASPIESTAIRFLIAIIPFIILGLFKFRINKISSISVFISLLMIAMVSYVLLYPLQLYGLKTISTSHSAVLMLLSPVFVNIISNMRAENKNKASWATMSLGFIGAFIIISDSFVEDSNNINLVGALLTILAAFFWALSLIMTKEFVIKHKNFDNFSVTFWPMAFGALGLIIISSNNFNLNVIKNFEPEFWYASVYLALASSVGAFLLWNYSIKHCTPFFCGSTMYLKTPVAFAIGAFLAGENLSLKFYIGSLFVFICVVWQHLLSSKRES